ncbi:pleckstrin homology-like domain family B member 3 [Melanerpes formicivorus]|uniref:pleckstrin homology-like domain family B member 3 n=1 Tax=Melanerpes formicivorus TaxID=211600 RepID=UPI00358EF6BC
MGGSDPDPPPAATVESQGALDPKEAALKLQGLSLEDEHPLEDEGALPHSCGAQPHRSADPQVVEAGPEGAAVTAVGQLLFSHRRWILLDPPRVLALQSSLQGSFGLHRSGSLPRKRGGGEPGGTPPAPRPRSGVVALNLDPESYSACLKLVELELRLRQALAERERLLRARAARVTAPAPPPAPPAPPPAELDLLGALRARGHVPEGCGWVRLSGGSCRGSLTKAGGRLRTWRRRWFHLDPRRGLLAYYRDKEERKLKGLIYLQAIQEVYYDPGGLPFKSPNPRLTFCLKTLERVFCLVAPSPEALRIWMDALVTVTKGEESD